jgi:hypothetical protein
MELPLETVKSTRDAQAGSLAWAVPRRIAVVSAYVALGVALLWSRLAHLGHSFWTDEIEMVVNFVRPGLREILTGGGLTHQLMAVLCWGAANTIGESELAFRLFSAVPFVAGVLIVTAWLHVRISALSGILFLFLATVSPLLLDISRQARGYGLAFFAMSVVVVAALEALRTGRRWAVGAMWIAGLIGALTLPQVGIAVVATAAVLVLDRRTRLPAAVGLAVVATAGAAWYIPHWSGAHAIAQYPDGVQIGFPWVVTAPVDQTVLPGLFWIDGTALLAGAIWLPLILLAALVCAYSPLAREWHQGAVLLAGPVVTMLVLWIGQAYVIPRYVSYLLAPLFVLIATGAAAVLQTIGRRRDLLAQIACLVVIGVLAVRFVTLAPDVVGLPREALRDTAQVIERGPPGTPVLAYMRHAQHNLGFYLDEPVKQLDAEDVAAEVCYRPRPVFYVEQLNVLEPVDVPCLSRSGTQLTVLRQYTRGGKISVWLVPPAR